MIVRLLTTAALIGAACIAVSSLPDVARYLKIRKM